MGLWMALHHGAPCSPCVAGGEGRRERPDDRFGKEVDIISLVPATLRYWTLVRDSGFFSPCMERGMEANIGWDVVALKSVLGAGPGLGDHLPRAERYVCSRYQKRGLQAQGS